MEKLGIIAGAGDLPLLLAQAAFDQGRLPIVIQITSPPSEGLAGVASEAYSFGIGQVQKITRTFLDSGVRELVIIGKIDKSILFRPFRVDPTAIKILARTRNKGPHAIIAEVIDHFESRGIAVIEQHRFLKGLMPKAGVLTKKQPTPSQWADVEYGMGIARRLAGMDIGQTVVIKGRIPVAVEAVEGTDEAITRGGTLGGKGIVVAKAATPHHDFRIDVPTIGDRTLEVLHAVRGSVLAVEAGRTFVMNQKTLCEQADRWKISIVAVE
ncbi:MAG: UDP-2,3-diacylglucosamine diphosphatase LpxI [Candidatus Poribacteria bacterium]|nr:UDP-2,3-diacylglucosamine diphosphatase LpxI [Candidatus Poribacteria bacterium]